jgi:hypothetical protein
MTPLDPPKRPSSAPRSTYRQWYPYVHPRNGNPQIGQQLSVTEYKPGTLAGPALQEFDKVQRVATCYASPNVPPEVDKSTISDEIVHYPESRQELRRETWGVGHAKNTIRRANNNEIPFKYGRPITVSYALRMLRDGQLGPHVTWDNVSKVERLPFKCKGHTQRRPNQISRRRLPHQTMYTFLCRPRREQTQHFISIKTSYTRWTEMCLPL